MELVKYYNWPDFINLNHCIGGGSRANSSSSTCNPQTSQQKYLERKVQNGCIGRRSLGASVSKEKKETDFTA